MVSILEKEDFKRSVLKRLVYSVGKDTDFAVPRDWCVALTLAVRERQMDRWMSTTKQVYKEDVKRVYYLSMEFLIGRLLADTMANLGITGVAPTRRWATAASGGWPPVSWTRCRPLASRPSATASVTNTACSASTSGKAGRSRKPRRG
jgi:hypothetical protein